MTGFIIALVGLIICCVLLSISSSVWAKVFGWQSLSPLPAPKKEGSICTLGTDCEGNLAGQAGTLSCCVDIKTNTKTCQKQVNDYSGFGYCPTECKGTFSGQPGTCTVSGGARKDGESCQLSTDCAGFVVNGGGSLACCGTAGNKKCTTQVKDFANMGQCPEECKGTFSGPFGTCTATGGPRKAGESCQLSTDCDGFEIGSANTLACCGSSGKKICTKQVKDWQGTGQCPEECVSAPAGTPDADVGTCVKYPKYPRTTGQPCAINQNCDGFQTRKTGTLACCNNKCTKQVTDYTGAGYCPSECKGSPTDPAGSCSKGYHWPRSVGEPCNLGTDCTNNDIGLGKGTQCCNGKCENKVKDFAGYFYCKNDCSKGLDVNACSSIS